MLVKRKAGVSSILLKFNVWCEDLSLWCLWWNVNSPHYRNTHLWLAEKRHVSSEAFLSDCWQENNTIHIYISSAPITSGITNGALQFWHNHVNACEKEKFVIVFKKCSCQSFKCNHWWRFLSVNNRLWKLFTCQFHFNVHACLWTIVMAIWIPKTFPKSWMNLVLVWRTQWVTLHHRLPLAVWLDAKSGVLRLVFKMANVLIKNTVDLTRVLC